MTTAFSEGANRRIDLLGIARRRAWVVVLLTVICAAVAYGVARGQQKTYTAGSLLLFQQQPLGQEFLGYTPAPVASDAGVAQATNVELASASGIVPNDRQEAAYLDEGGNRCDRCCSCRRQSGRQRYSHRGKPDGCSEPGQRLRRDSRRRTPLRAARTRRSATDRVQSQLDLLQQSAASKSQVAELKNRLDQLRLLADVQTGDVQVADLAAPPTSPSGPRIHRDIAFGVLIGALLGLMVVVLLEQHDRRLRHEDELVSHYGLPVLARIPYVKEPAVRTATRARQPDPLLAEAHLLLRARLRYFNADRQVQTLLVTSALPQEGKSTVAWNLAQAAVVSSPDERVLLIEADMRRPTLSATAGFDPAPGLAEALTQLVPWREAIQSIDLGATGGGVLDVLPAGVTPPNPAQLAESERMRDLLAEARLEYGFIVIDAPPPLIVSDALALLRHVDGVVVVGRLKYAMRDAVRRLSSTMTELKAPLLGVVINGLDRGEQSYGYESYGPPPNFRAKRSTSLSP